MLHIEAFEMHGAEHPRLYRLSFDALARSAAWRLAVSPSSNKPAESLKYTIMFTELLGPGPQPRQWTLDISDLRAFKVISAPAWSPDGRLQLMAFMGRTRNVHVDMYSGIDDYFLNVVQASTGNHMCSFYSEQWHHT